MPRDMLAFGKCGKGPAKWESGKVDEPQVYQRANEARGLAKRATKANQYMSLR
jgi:hypothetical protein